jgi:hypothetical protein
MLLWSLPMPPPVAGAAGGVAGAFDMPGIGTLYFEGVKYEGNSPGGTGVCDATGATGAGAAAAGKFGSA